MLTPPVLQILSVRLGAVTSDSLPAQTRALFLRWEAKYPKYKRALRWCLYALWALAEIAIIATDLAELLGSAIALNLLFPRLPLFAGVLITAADVMVVLLFFRSNSGRQGMMFFEFVIVALVLAVFVSFMILLHLIKPEWREVFLGLVPSRTLVKPGALYVGVGIIGATVMPHALFLGSHLASVDRLGMLPVLPSRAKKPINNRLPSFNPLGRLRRRNPEPQPETTEVELEEVNQAGPSQLPDLPRVESDVGIAPAPKTFADKDDDDYQVAMEKYDADVRAFDRIRWADLHVIHATIDTSYSLLGFALTINASILTLAGAAYYYGQSGATDDADLAGAHALIKDYIGNGAAIIFALALLCAGQSASITATLAGQVVSEGFLEWKTSPMLRRLLTRLIGVVPAAIVAVAVGNKGLDDMLVASQVVLSIVLPTVTIPLVYLCSQKDVMVVLGPIDETQPPVRAESVPASALASAAASRQASPAASHLSLPLPLPCASRPSSPSLEVPPPAQPAGVRRRKFFTSSKWVTALGYSLCGIVILANGYVIVELCLGNA